MVIPMVEPHPQVVEEQQNTQILRLIRFISFWMILSIYPGVQSFGLEKQNQLVMIFESVTYLGMFFCAISLFFKREWARVMSVFFLMATFIFNLYVSINLIGPYFSSIVTNVSEAYLISEKIVRHVVVLLLIFYIIWPTLVICVLTHPRVKDLFRNNDV